MIIYTLVYNLESEKITIVIYHYYIFLILSTITASPIAFTFHDTDGMVRNHSNLLRNMGIASGDQWWETCWLRVIAVMLMNGNYFRYLYVFFSQCFFCYFRVLISLIGQQKHPVLIESTINDGIWMRYIIIHLWDTCIHIYILYNTYVDMIWEYVIGKIMIYYTHGNGAPKVCHNMFDLCSPIQLQIVDILYKKIHIHEISWNESYYS